MGNTWLEEVQKLDMKTRLLNEELEALQNDKDTEVGSTDYLFRLLEIQLKQRELSREADRLSKCQY